MTITTNDDRDEYTATSGQTVFNYTFKIFESTDLNVYQTPAAQDFDDGADLITAYTVTGEGSASGGTITLTTGATTGDRITIVSAIPSSRTTDYQVNGDFTPATVNADFDRSVSLAKQAEGLARRSPKFIESRQGVSDFSLPEPIANTFWRVNSTATGMDAFTANGAAITAEIPVADYAAARALDSSTLTDGQVITVTDDGIAGQFVVKTGTVTDNGGVLIVFTDDSNRYAERIYNTADGVHIEWFGGGAGGVTDNLAAFNACKALKQPINYGQGVYYHSTKISTSASESAALIIRGAGMSQTVLMFRGTDGLELLGTGNALRDLCIVDGDSFASLPTDTSDAVDPRPVRVSIDASVIGLRMDRNNIVVDNVWIRGFGIGRKFSNTKFYMSNYKVRTDSNLIGMQFGSGFATDSPNFNFSYSCYDGNNFQRNIHGQSGFHVFVNQSSELCDDYAADNSNFPDGGIWIEPKAHAVFDKPYIEEINIYNSSDKTVFDKVSNIWDAVCFRPTRFYDLVFGRRSENLIQPPWRQSWRAQADGSVSIDNDPDNIAGGKRYTRLTASGAGGVSKVVFSHWNDSVRGITPQGIDNLEIKVYAGFWVRVVSGTFTDGDPFFRPQFEDTSSNLFYSNEPARLVVHDDDDGFNRARTGASGTTTGATTDKLVDSGATFTSSVMVGMEVENTADKSKSKIVSIDSNTELTLDDDIFVSGEAYDIPGWQYMASLHTLRGGGSFATGNPLSRCRLTIEVESSATDCSSTNRIIDISEPELRLFTSQGSLASNTTPRLESVTELTISGGEITVVDGYHTVDTESDAASDDLDTINCDDLYPGRELTITAANAARDVVAKDTTGNLRLNGDFTMSTAGDTLKLIYNGTNWLETSRSNNS